MAGHISIEKSFAEAWINSDHTVLGRKLRPFCLWHIHLLQTLESPYLIKGAIRPFDLANAVGICSLRYSDNDIRRPGGLRKWWVCRTMERFERESGKFVEYIGDFLQRPEFTIIEPKNAGTQTPRGQPPEVLQVASDVIEHLRCPEPFAWELPIGKAYWYQAMYLKSKHDLDFMTTDERDYQQKLKAKLEREKNAAR